MQITWEAARRNAGLKQREVCKHVGIGLNTLIDWEKYRKYPNVVYERKLCSLYGCELGDILIDPSANENFAGEANGTIG